MCARMIVLFVILLHTCIALASDPDPIFDYCIAKTGPKTDNTRCKDPSAATEDDFVYSGIKKRADTSKTGIITIRVDSNVLPGMNTLGMSFARVDYNVSGVNSPHYHPRATEVAYVAEGKIFVGFVGEENRVFGKVLEQGEVMVIPRALIHFQRNIGNTPATLLASFDSQYPGLIRIPNTMFQAKIDDEIMKNSFKMSIEEINDLRKRLSPHELNEEVMAV